MQSVRVYALACGAAAFIVDAAAPAVTVDWTPVANPGNAADTTGFGAVGYAYRIGTFEVTNAQYAEFLSAKAASDPMGLYNESMGSGFGGIEQTCSLGRGCTYRVIPGRGDMPVNYVSFYDALRFANWLNNGQGDRDTETGAYTLLGGSATPIDAAAVKRNAGATVVLPSEDEWYKAAYHNASGLTIRDYFSYPAGSTAQTTCAAPGPTPNRANCGDAVADLTPRGSYRASASPYGTFDQGGNVWEWTESIFSGSLRVHRGGSFFVERASYLAASSHGGFAPSFEWANVGFRVVMIPGPPPNASR